MTDWVSRRVVASDGVSLAVFEAGTADGPTLLLVHGYPDDHHVWDGVAADLRHEFRLVCFDTRGAGASAPPAQRNGYRVDQLADDIEAVATSIGDGPVHLVGHDWGSCQGWRAVTRDGAPARFVSYTSISGPDLAMAGAWFQHTLRTDRRAALAQLMNSWYLLLFRLPLLPELMWRSGLGFRMIGRRATPGATRTAINGLGIYRANLTRAARTRPRRCTMPVQVLAPRHDSYVGIAVQTQSPARWAKDLRTAVIEGSHWTMVNHPERVADPVREFVRATLKRGDD